MSNLPPLQLRQKGTAAGSNAFGSRDTGYECRVARVQPIKISVKQVYPVLVARRQRLQNLHMCNWLHQCFGGSLKKIREPESSLCRNFHPPPCPGSPSPLGICRARHYISRSHAGLAESSCSVCWRDLVSRPLLNPELLAALSTHRLLCPPSRSHGSPTFYRGQHDPVLSVLHRTSAHLLFGTK